MIHGQRSVILCVLLFAAGAAAQTQQGIGPRPDVKEYPVRIQQGNIAVGAVLLSNDEVHRLFATGLNRGYMVFEVACYPAAGVSCQISHSDFTLQVVGGTSSLRPMEPVTIVGQLQRDAGSSRDITLYPTVGVGVETGPRGYDPTTGQTRRGTGVWTSTGVGVGMGSGGGYSDRDLQVMEQELTDKSLPEGTFSKPVCGYLYFPFPPNKKGELRLVADIDGQRLVLTFPRKK